MLHGPDLPQVSNLLIPKGCSQIACTQHRFWLSRSQSSRRACFWAKWHKVESILRENMNASSAFFQMDHSAAPGRTEDCLCCLADMRLWLTCTVAGTRCRAGSRRQRMHISSNVQLLPCRGPKLARVATVERVFEKQSRHPQIRPCKIRQGQC